MSTTLTVNDSLPLVPAASVAVQVTVVVPNGKTVSEAREQLGFIGPSTKSLAQTSPYTTFAPFGPVASATSLAGTVTAGGGGVLHRDGEAVATGVAGLVGVATIET